MWPLPPGRSPYDFLINHFIAVNHKHIFFNGRVPPVHRGRRPDRRREEDEEDDVGTVLVIPPALLQVPLHCKQGRQRCCICYDLGVYILKI